MSVKIRNSFKFGFVVIEVFFESKWNEEIFIVLRKRLGRIGFSLGRISHRHKGFYLEECRIYVNFFFCPKDFRFQAQVGRGDRR